MRLSTSSGAKIPAPDGCVGEDCVCTTFFRPLSAQSLVGDTKRPTSPERPARCQPEHWLTYRFRDATTHMLHNPVGSEDEPLVPELLAWCESVVTNTVITPYRGNVLVANDV